MGRLLPVYRMGVDQDMDALDIDQMQELTLRSGPTILSI